MIALATYDAAALFAPTIEAHSQIGIDFAEILERRVREHTTPKVESLVAEIQQIALESAHEAVRVIDEDTVFAATSFARLLPWSLPFPEVAPDPDGEISFDWFGGSGKMFSVSVNSAGRIAYAGRFGDKSKVNGMEYLSQVLPSEVMRGIVRATR